MLGGTLDPIHVGHIDTALAARDALALDRVIVLPSRVPPHRPQQPVASRVPPVRHGGAGGERHRRPGRQRRRAARAGAVVHGRHAGRASASAGLPASQIFFITGADAFAEIETWNRYPEVLDLAHSSSSRARGFRSSGCGERLPALAARMRAASTRGGRDRGVPTSIFLVDAPTPDVSSTEIRRRLRAGGALTRPRAAGGRAAHPCNTVCTLRRSTRLTRGRSLAWPKLKETRRAATARRSG